MLRIISELNWRTKKRAEYTETFWYLCFSGLPDAYSVAAESILLRRNLNKRLVNHFRSLFQ